MASDKMTSDKEIICIECGAQFPISEVEEGRCPYCEHLLTNYRSSVYEGKEKSEYEDYEFSL